MTYTVTNFPMHERLNNRMVREVTAAGPTSYATGGDAIDAAALGLSQVFGVYGQLSNGTTIVVPFFDFANQKLMFWVMATDAQVANAVDLSGFTGTLLITGK